MLKKEVKNIFKMLWICACIIALQNCTKQEYQENISDSTIINSPELEEYIITGLDLEQSLINFTNELNKTDFSKLVETQDSEGRKMISLPANVASINIEDKLYAFNEKKEILQEKYPQLSSRSSKTINKYIMRTIRGSVKVQSRLLELKINIPRPLLKDGKVENYSGSSAFEDLHVNLWDWTVNPNYVEMVIIAYQNGQYSTWIDDRNTDSDAKILPWLYTDDTDYNDYVYFDKAGIHSPVIWIAHTHIRNTNISNNDKAFKKKFPNILHFIYYKGGFYYI